MSSSARISVVVPVYNEHENIATCLRGLWRVLEGHEHEILVVYDFDADSTLPAIAAMGDAPPSLRLIKNTIGKGAANAIRAGFAAASGDVVVTTMADLSDPPEKILDLAAQMRASGDAVVAGSRYMEGGVQMGGPLIKRTLSRCAGLSLRWFAGLGTHDATNNFKAYSRRFLEQVKVEAEGAFDIGLELSVKAHLANAGVSEVPTSWVDREAGTSRFQVWKWAPKYMRWYWMAMREPLLVWLALIAAWRWESLTTDWTGGILGIEPAIHVGLALVAALGVLAVRRLRGQMRWYDALLPLAWCNPWLHDVADNRAPLWSAGITLAFFVATTSLSGWKRVGVRLRRAVDLRLVASLLIAPVIWITQLHETYPDATYRLDPSWQRALEHFMNTSQRAGVDYVFTYGPLGAFNSNIELTELFFARWILFEGVLKSLGAWFMAHVALRRCGWLGALALMAALIFSWPNSDAALFTLVAFISAAILARARTFGPELWIGFALLVEIALVKFSFQLLVLPCVAIIALEAALRRPFGLGLAVGAIFVGMFGIGWVAAGQQLLDFPAYFYNSWQIADGYQSAMGVDQPSESHGFVIKLFALTAAAAAASIFASDDRRYASCVAAVAVLSILMGFKAAHITAPYSVLLPSTAAVAAVLFFVPLTRARSAPKLLCAALAGALVVFAMRDPTAQRPLTPATLREAVVERGEMRLDFYRTLGAQHGQALERIAAAREKHAMPKTTELLAGRSVDVLGVNQSLAYYNGWNYRQRPVFQSYSAYTAHLLELNAAFLRSDDAPEFLVWRLDAYNSQSGLGTDAAAVEAALTRYRPQMFERGFMVLQLDRERPREFTGRQTLVERELARGESFVPPPAPPGKLRRVRIDVRRSALGELRTKLLRGPKASLEFRASDRPITRSWSFAPDPGRYGWLLDPPLGSQYELCAWACGEPMPQVTQLSWTTPAGQEEFFRPTARVTIELVDDPFGGSTDKRDEFLFSRFASPPSGRVDSLWIAFEDDGDWLACIPPLVLEWTLAPGRYRTQGLVKLQDHVVRDGAGDGGEVLVRQVSASGVEKVLSRAVLTPKAGQGHFRARGLVFEVEEHSKLTIELGAGAVREPRSDILLMRGLGFVPAKAKANSDADADAEDER